MAWEALLLFSPIRMSAGQYQGRNRTKNSNRPVWKSPSGEINGLKSGRSSVKPSLTPLMQRKGDVAHGSEARNGGCLHIDQRGAVGSSESIFFIRAGNPGTGNEQRSVGRIRGGKAFPGQHVDDARSQVSALWGKDSDKAPTQPIDQAHASGPSFSAAAKARVAAC